MLCRPYCRLLNNIVFRGQGLYLMKALRHLVLCCPVIFLLANQDARAQTGEGAISSITTGNWPPEFYMTAFFCILGFFVIICQFVLLLRTNDSLNASDVMRNFSTTLILIAVVALLGVGYSKDQVQPALGLFGTLLGYLMGRNDLSASASLLQRGQQPSEERSESHGKATSGT
jgi:hypothetical protein